MNVQIYFLFKCSVSTNIPDFIRVIEVKEGLTDHVASHLKFRPKTRNKLIRTWRAARLALWFEAYFTVGPGTHFFNFDFTVNFKLTPPAIIVIYSPITITR
jgi:hypothetical protein